MADKALSGKSLGERVARFPMGAVRIGDAVTGVVQSAIPLCLKIRHYGL
jgi:hypothetical protein